MDVVRSHDSNKQPRDPTGFHLNQPLSYNRTIEASISPDKQSSELKDVVNLNLSVREEDQV